MIIEIPEFTWDHFFLVLFRYLKMKLEDYTIHQIYKLYVVMYLAITPEAVNEVPGLDKDTEVEAAGAIESN